MIHPDRLDELTTELINRQFRHDTSSPDDTYIIGEAEQTPEDEIIMEQQRQMQPRTLPLLEKLFPLD